MSEQEKKELEKNQEAIRMADKEAKMLEEMENMRKKNEELEKEKIAKEFQNKNG